MNKLSILILGLVIISLTGGAMNRKVESKGTKASGSWVFEVTLTPTIGS